MDNQKLNLLAKLPPLTEDELRLELARILTNQKLGLVWESSAIERDAALNRDVVLPVIQPQHAHLYPAQDCSPNLIIEGDNFDSLRLLRATHAGKIRVIYIDPPYNTGQKDWVYNDDYVGEKDRWRHSQWLEFLYQRLTLARDLLTPDGAILVSINDENRSRLELLMDEVFPNQRLGSFVWKVRSGGNDTKGALLSTNHEHVLVYGSPAFSFRGDSRDEGAFDNPDQDPRGDWSNDNLVKAHNALQRPEAYYHIQNPQTGVWYLCDMDSVWRFASTSRPQKKELQAAPIETLIKERRILWPANERSVTYTSVAELKAAIDDGSAPKQFKIYKQLPVIRRKAKTDPKAQRLLSYIEPLEAWVGRAVGYGKPRYKRFLSQLKRDVTPLSSWLNPAADGVPDSEDDEVMLTVGATGEGTSLYKEILNNKDFQYPKPLSLIMGLLDQATRANDIVLDFFAGSGTTGQAVLELNAIDGGQRRFILCSSTEATAKEPDKNVCRDICAERLKRVIDGYGSRGGLDGHFAYLQTERMEPADLDMEINSDHILGLLALRYAGAATVTAAADAALHIINSNPEACVVYVPQVTEQALGWLKELQQDKVTVFSDRPLRVQEALEAAGKTVHSRSALDEATLICRGIAV